MTKALKDVLQRAESWPAQAQDELAQVALEIEAAIKGGAYHASADELRAIDEALAAVRRGELATDDEVGAVFAKHSGAYRSSAILM
jgi:hypothetical protein